jgi:hypothetical protein
MFFDHFDQRAVVCKGVAATRQFWRHEDFFLCFVHIDKKDRRERSLLRQITNEISRPSLPTECEARIVVSERDTAPTD